MSLTKPVRLRGLAVADVDDAIRHYLQEAGPDVALGFIDGLEQAHTHLGRQPGTGSSRYAQELNLPGLRSCPLGLYPYIVFYVEQSDHVDVWRVLHSARDMPFCFLEGDPALP